MTNRFIARPDTWFKAGTECQLIDDYRPQMHSGLFRGTRICQNSAAEAGKPVGLEYDDEEICPFSEFDVVCGNCGGKGYWWPPYIGGDDDGPEACPDCGGNERARDFCRGYYDKGYR